MERVLDRLLQVSAALIRREESDLERGFSHRPVLLRETVQYLDVRPGGAYIDCTVGEGGHALAILRAAMPAGRLLGIDLDPDSLARARQRLDPYNGSFVLHSGNYSAIGDFASRFGFKEPDGVLMDLGMSSLHLESSGRGFSLLRDEPLDMRYDPEASLTAADIVNGFNMADLARLISDYGEERGARSIARAIAQSRPLAATHDLADLVARVKGRRRGRIHPATRVFQALRIAVNNELGNLRAGLQASIDLLKPGGRLAVISYHSLEDRIVKETMAREARKCICPREVLVCTCGHAATLKVISRKIITPSSQEVSKNPRSRSARMRVAQRLLPNQ